MNYYPYGASFDQSSNRQYAHNYRFNGKELVPDLGLNWYFYGLRNNFDPLLGRFHSIDPLATLFPQWSSYQFAGLNPTKYVDLDGAEPAYYDIQSGQIVPAGDQLSNYAPADAQFIGTGIDPDSYSGFAETATELLMGLTPIDEINTFVTGQTADGREAGFKDYIDAGIEVVLIGRKGTGKQGGAYKDLDVETGLQERHHMPSSKSLKDSDIGVGHRDGPSLKMEKTDHAQTASYGRRKSASEYRRRQTDLIKQGKFEEAQQMDINDVRSKFGSKYDEGIQQIQDYTRNLLDDQ